ncbi:MAG: FecR domain-containing protein [Cyclobacteriaceae bacterium]
MKDIDELILKYLQGNITLEEQYQLTQWMELDKDNEKTFKRVQAYWKDYSLDYSSVKSEIEEKIFGQIKKNQPIESPAIISGKLLLKIAAMVAILLTSSFLVYHFTNAESEQVAVKPIAYIEKSSLAGQKITTVLSDGTKVHLNSNSKLIVPERFEEDKRRVQLIGEAFFDVARDESKPFQITTEDFVINVLGTSFNVSAYQEGSNHVAVKEGIVSVKTDPFRSVELNANQMIKIYEDGNISELSKVNEVLIFGWIDQVLAFQDLPIQQVFDKVSQWYGVEITLEKKGLPKKLFTASFKNPTLNELLLNVSRVYGFNYEIKDGIVTIR